jgi:hypothetical protein
MNPETQSTRAKITQTRVDPQIQAAVGSPRSNQDQWNSGDVAQRRAAGSGISAESQESRSHFISRTRHARNPSDGSGVSQSWAA